MIEKELKTSTKTRVAIIIVAILMLFSTVALYIGIILGYNNNNGDSLAQTDPEKQAQFQKLYEEYTGRLDDQAKALSDKYFSKFSSYATYPKAYNAAAITEVASKDIIVGDGDEILEGATNYSAYYVGWLSDGTIFDSSFSNIESPNSLKFPLPGGDMIEGWNQGIIGMKIGGIREIAMPAELAYGAEERGTIPPNSPLKFAIMLVDREEQLDWTEEMYALYAELYGDE